MALPIVYGIDPDETWELDYTEAWARRLVRANRLGAEQARKEAAKEKDEAKRQGFEEAAARCDRTADQLVSDLERYEPGSGPVFIIGPIPNGRRAEILGESIEVARIEDAKQGVVRDEAWSSEVVRWSVRGHRGLVSRKGGKLKTIAFTSEPVTWAGEERQVVSRKTLEAYGASGILGRLASLVLESQSLDESEKNG